MLRHALLFALAFSSAALAQGYRVWDYDASSLGWNTDELHVLPSGDLLLSSGGPARELASHAGFIAHEGEVLRLSLAPADEHLKAPALVKMLADALAPSLGAAPQIRFEAASAAGETFHERSSRERDARQLAAEQAFVDDPGVQRLVARHGARVVPDSIRPFDEA